MLTFDCLHVLFFLSAVVCLSHQQCKSVFQILFPGLHLILQCYHWVHIFVFLRCRGNIFLKELWTISKKPRGQWGTSYWGFIVIFAWRSRDFEVWLSLYCFLASILSIWKVFFFKFDYGFGFQQRCSCLGNSLELQYFLFSSAHGTSPHIIFVL